ncbi:MAG: hypothetical protein ABW023_01425 [Sphingomonas sp.]
MDNRILNAKLYLHALRTGSAEAVAALVDRVVPDAILSTGKECVEGREDVLTRITGQWPLTSVYHQGAWSEPTIDGDNVTVSGRFDWLGASPNTVNLAFAFDGEDRIREVTQQNIPASPQPSPDAIPDSVAAMVNSALANGTPLVLGYVGEDGKAKLSLRGSVQVSGPRQLSMWLRNAEGGAAKLAARGGDFTLLYRDSRARQTVTFEGKGSIVADAAQRDLVYHFQPEAERKHDPQRKGAAMLLDVTRLQAFTIAGMIRAQWDD